MTHHRLLALSLAIVSGAAHGQAAKAPDKAAEDAAWKAVQTCQAAVAVTMKWHDPSSVQWPQISRSFRELKQGTYTVQVVARAKNAFNATVTNTFECRIRASDYKPLKVFKVE